MRNTTIWILLVLPLLGCAAGASSVAMTVGPGASDISVSSQHKGTIWVEEVSGGKETSPMWISNVSNGEFRSALEGSLRNQEYLATSAQDAKYRVKAELVELDQPLVGFNLTVKATVSYVITQAQNAQAISKRIAASASATMSDAFVAATRLRIANERAIQANIKEFLREVPSLP
jgi:hypothetical protein